MYFYPGERKVRLSIREFAEFRAGPTIKMGGSHMRAAIGTAWHNELQSQTIKKHPTALFEQSIAGKWVHKGWTIELQGRIDQIVEDQHTRRLREIKSTTVSLPLDEESLIKKYPHYLSQLAAYLVLDQILQDNKNKAIIGELVFVNINDGITQTILLNDAEQIFNKKLDTIHQFMEERWSSKQRILRCEFEPAFETPREGQPEAKEAIESAFHKTKMLAFEAPTGFGKTGMILEFALNRLAEGSYSRILYLTGKSTGQLQVVKQLKTMLPKNDSLLYFQLRNKKEHESDLPAGWLQQIDSLKIEEQWNNLNISPASLFNNGTITLDEIKKLGIRSGIHPYEISRTCIPYADILIADYNYVFSPENRHILLDQPDFDPKQTLLIIDEAHNLPSRVATAFSHTVNAKDIQQAVNELRNTSTHPILICAWEYLAKLISSLKQAEQHELSIECEIIDALETLLLELRKYAIDFESLSEEVTESINSIYKVKRFIEHKELKKLIWSSRDKIINFSCLDASTEISSTLESYGNTVLMSATLSPAEAFTHSCGLQPEQISFVTGKAPWRINAYQVAIDTRVDTRLRSRERYYASTASTVIRSTLNMPAPVAVFFSSYRYAETIKTYIEADSPLLLVALQPRKTNLQQQYDFIQESLLCAHAIFLVLGSSFTESIDLLGGKITRAIVVGPALPEVNAIQKARMNEFSDNKKEQAFHHVYQIPAIRKINQALGRLVRAPGHSAQILLHDKRFKEESYLRLLSPEYEADIINNDKELDQWMGNKE